MCCLTIWDGFLFKYALFAQKYGKSAALLCLLRIWDLGFVQLLILSSRIRKILESSGSGHPCVAPLCSVKLCVVLVCILCTLLINNG